MATWHQTNEACSLHPEHYLNLCKCKHAIRKKEFGKHKKT